MTAVMDEKLTMFTDTDALLSVLSASAAMLDGDAATAQQVMAGLAPEQALTGALWAVQAVAVASAGWDCSAVEVVRSAHRDVMLSLSEDPDGLESERS